MMFYSTGAPDPPTGLSATQVGLTSVRVSWTAPVSGAAVTGYIGYLTVEELTGVGWWMLGLVQLTTL